VYLNHMTTIDTIKECVCSQSDYFTIVLSLSGARRA